MGYSSSFVGEILFDCDMKTQDMVEVNKFLGARYNSVNWHRWKHERIHDSLVWINLKFNKHGNGLKWDGSEKVTSTDIVAGLNCIIINMARGKPNFRMIGDMFVQGERVGDIGFITCNPNKNGGLAEFVTVGEYFGRLNLCSECIEKIKKSMLVINQ